MKFMSNVLKLFLSQHNKNKILLYLYFFLKMVFVNFADEGFFFFVRHDFTDVAVKK